MYNPENQYRCTIIRGKAQTQLDNLLPAYCRIINQLCPCSESIFKIRFNEMLSMIIQNPTEKTLNNHRTEIAGKLFGLWVNTGDTIFASPRVSNLLDTNDNPSFFKELSIKLQFPNGMDKLNTVKDRITNRIKFRPFPFILSLIRLFESSNLHLRRDELAYYVMNNLDVLRGNATCNEVFEVIIKHRTEGKELKVDAKGKAPSYSVQHINEQINLFELSNLIRTQSDEAREKIVTLNESESNIIDQIIVKYLNNCEFDAYTYDLNNSAEVKKFYADWDSYYSTPLQDINLLSKPTSFFDSNELELVDGVKIEVSSLVSSDPLAIGEEGENLVMEYEKQRIGKFNSRLKNKVIHLGKQKGLGYDISSIVGEGPKAEHAIFIEVKTTMRVTEPTLDFTDQFDMTRNEWVASEQYSDTYFIYRVYLYKNGYKIIKLTSPYKLKQEGQIFAEPLKYHIEFSPTIGDCIYEQ